MFLRLNSLLALLLASNLLLVQTALPWLHFGCEHDHSISQASPAPHTHGAGRCSHHSHATDAVAPGQPVVEHRHDPVPAEDCAACRSLLLPSLVATASDSLAIEPVALLAAPLRSLVARGEVVGLYRSRAPPALS